jgi:hypothetical protein
LRNVQNRLFTTPTSLPICVAGDDVRVSET